MKVVPTCHTDCPPDGPRDSTEYLEITYNYKIHLATFDPRIARFWNFVENCFSLQARADIDALLGSTACWDYCAHSYDRDMDEVLLIFYFKEIADAYAFMLKYAS